MLQPAVLAFNKLASLTSLFLAASNMAARSIKEMREELSRLMDEQIASLKRERYGGLSPGEMLQNEERLKRIREVSADYLAELKKNDQ